MPAIAWQREFADAGGLISYGPSFRDCGGEAIGPRLGAAVVAGKNLRADPIELNPPDVHFVQR